jgi:putative hydrolase of the HAD superfamily
VYSPAVAEGARSRIDAIFCDVGGVCLSNGWGAGARAAAAAHFGLETGDLEARHAEVVDPFERGDVSLDAYLDRVVFYRDRPFGRDAFTGFMRTQSRPNEPVLDLLRVLAAAKIYRLATINNESRELNRYRIDAFGLDAIFQAFFSSCYLGVRKPDRRIYAIALDVLHAEPAASVFVDDRPENVDAARGAGLQAIHFTDPVRLAHELRALGVEVPGQG